MMERNYMKINKLFASLLILFAAATAANSQAVSEILDQIEQAIPEKEAGWKLESSKKITSHDVWRSFSKWTNGKEIVEAIVIVMRDIKAAANSYNSEFSEEKKTFIDGIGEVAIDETPGNVSDSKLVTIKFRKAGVIVILASDSEKIVKRMAKHITNAIPAESEYSKTSPQPPNSGDFCHVYLVDKWKARELDDARLNAKYSNAFSLMKESFEIQTEFPEFQTNIGEEILTTKTFPFPNSKSVITASVYYTDESMASKKGVDSMLVGIVVAPMALEDALAAENNVFAEITFYDRDMIRVKQNVKVKAREYLLGMECRSIGENNLP